MSTICKDQTTFNDSVHEAIKYVRKKNKPKTWAQITMAVIWVIFIVWAIMLAFKMPENVRNIHCIFAIVGGPLYILAYYVGMPN